MSDEQKEPAHGALEEVKRALEQFQDKAQNDSLALDVANRVALDILSSRTGIEALRRIAEAARVLSHARYAALGVARANGKGLSDFVTTGLTFEEEAAIGPRPTGGGVLGLLLKQVDPLRVDVLQNHPASVGFPSNHPPMKSFLGVPIRRGNEVLGSLYLTDKEGGAPFTEADEKAVQTLGAHAAVAIHNHQLLSRQRSLVSGLIAAQEEERRVVAYDLHDGLTQYIMASHAHMEAFLSARDAGKQERSEKELEIGLQYLKEAVLESRRMVNGLRSLALDDLGLAGALELLFEEEKTRAGWEDAEFLYNIAGVRYSKSLETTVYRIAQEALTNTRKHAMSSRVRLSLLSSHEPESKIARLTLEVRDWGIGFDSQQSAHLEDHFGLQSMVERVNIVNGIFTIQSVLGDGTNIRAIFSAFEPEGAQTE